MVLLLVVDDRALEVLGEDVAHDAHRQVRLLEDQRRRRRRLDALLEDLVELEQVLQLALEIRSLGAVRRGPDDRAAATQIELLGLLAKPVALAVLQPAGHADALAGGRVDHVAPGDRQLHRQARALGLQGVLDDLDDDLLPRLEQLVDARPVAAAALGLLDAGQHDLVDVQEPVLVEPDVDERRLEAGEDIVDAAVVDVADDRAAAATLEVDLRYAVTGGNFMGLAAARTPPRFGRRARISGRLQHGDAGLAAIHRDQYLLFQGTTSLEDGGPPLAIRRLARLRVDGVQEPEGQESGEHRRAAETQ